MSLLLLPLGSAQTPVPGDLKTPAPLLPAKTGEPPLASDLVVAARATLAGQQDAAPAAVQATVRQAARRSALADRVVFDQPGDGSLWAGTARYKASFGADGMTLVPFFGSDAPRNYPVRFELVGVAAGGAALGLDAAAGAVRAGQRVTIDRGPVAEVYELAPGSVEQLFTIAARPGEGDLTLRVRVTTELRASQTDAGIAFGNELGQVGYGAAFLVDAARMRTPLSQRLDDGCIEIRVPASVLATAVFPLTVDPIINVFPVSTRVSNDHAPDIAYDGQTNRYFVVWEYDYSASDHDIYGEFYNPNGTPVPGSFVYLDISTTFWARPRVACIGGGSAMLTVAERGVPGTRRVWARQAFGGNPGQMGPQFEVTTQVSATQECFNADVAGTTSGVGGGWWLVVFERVSGPSDHDILGQLVQNSSPWQSVFAIDGSVGTFDSAPSVARSIGDAPATGWPVVWQRRYSVTDEDLYGALVGHGGGLVRSTFTIDYSTRSDTHPVVSSVTDDMNGERFFLVAYEGLVASGDHDILIQMRSWSGNVTIGPVNLSAVDGPTRGRDQTLPNVDSDGARFALAHSEFNPGTGSHDAFVWTLGINRNQVVSVSDYKVPVAATGAHELGVRVFAQHSARTFDHRVAYGLVFEQGGNIAAATYEGMSAGGYRFRGSACYGLSAVTIGRPVIGGEAYVYLQNVGSDAPLMMVGPPAQLVYFLGCLGCAFGVDPSVSLFFAGAQLMLPIPTDSYYVGMTLTMQGLTIGSGCNNTFRLSEAVDITIQ